MQPLCRRAAFASAALHAGRLTPVSDRLENAITAPFLELSTKPLIVACK
jgi:hypothetical protein